jgi:redox-sensitive bicupin YhaK (pirin superfamily)
VTLVDLALDANATFEQELPLSYNGFVYVVEGSAGVRAVARYGPWKHGHSCRHRDPPDCNGKRERAKNQRRHWRFLATNVHCRRA